MVFMSSRFWLISLLGLACSLFVAPQMRKWNKFKFAENPEIEETAGSRAELNDSFSSIIQSGFNRDSLLQDFSIGRRKIPFDRLKQVELLTTNTSNGIQLLVDDPSNFIRYLRSPESVRDLIPALVCDVVFFCVSFGQVEKYRTFLQWREAYVEQHPGGCLLWFRNDGKGMKRKALLLLKLLNHLYLIKAISDGRIITRTKYNELLQSGLMSTPTSAVGRPRLKHEDSTSVKEFIRLLTPHMSSGIGVPSNADMSQYPIMFYLDMDTLFTNKSITVPNFLQQVDEGLKLQSLIPAVGDDTNTAPYSSSAADFVISNDIACDQEAFTTINSGIHLSRPTSAVAYLVMAAGVRNRDKVKRSFEDQGALTQELQLMSDFNASRLIALCRAEPSLFYQPEYLSRIIFAAVLSENSADPEDLKLTEMMAQRNRQRIEHMETIWGSPAEYRNGSRVPLAVVVNARWCNSMILPQKKKVLWHPGDWIVHFTQYTKTERKYGEPIRKWICDNLDSVAHPNDWPTSPIDCPQFIDKGFSYIPSVFDYLIGQLLWFPNLV